MRTVSFLERDERLHSRFGHLTEGVKSAVTGKPLSEHDQNKMQILMDNLMKDQCCQERINYESIDIAALSEQTATGNIAFVVRNDLAMINKVFPNMIAKEICSIQPIIQPNAKIFYTDMKKSSDDTSLSTNIHGNRTFSNNVEYNPDSPTAIQDIYFEITSDDVVAIEKKLKAHATVEVSQDLMAYHGKDVESILSNGLSAQIAREWDRTIIQNMIDAATGGAATFSKAEPSGLSYQDRKYWMETLYEKMIDVDNAIFKKRYRRTNFAVVGADEAAFIEKMSGFRADTIDIAMQQVATGGRYFMGTLNNRWKIYVDPFLSGKILMGYNNPAQWEETAYVFAPYILSYFSPWFIDPNTLRKTRAILSRAAYKAVITDLLGVVTVTAS